MTQNEMKTLKMNILGGMHEYVRHINDERAYEMWIELGVPDEPTEDDLEFIAEDLESWVDCVKVFKSCVASYVRTSADEVVD